MGTKFAACDHSGKVSLWRWDDDPSSLLPYWSVNCHSGRTSDLAFLNHGRFVATPLCLASGCVSYVVLSVTW